jgi:Spy/CpxP family protein refolding chaperone
MKRQDAALGKAAGMEKETGCSEYSSTPNRKQAIRAARRQRQRELSRATKYQRQLYRAIKLRLGGRLL